MEPNQKSQSNPTPGEIKFMEAFNAMAFDVFSIAQEHGWWANERSDGECIALMHSELSEALESMRNHSPPDHHCPVFKNTEVELADCIIRIMDFAQMKGLDVAGALVAKVNFNRERPYRHGGKAF